MRDLKFRAWDYQFNKWATENDVVGSMGLIFGIKDYFINIAGEKAVRFSFLQYTGLTDKNGKEIYEGDLVLIRANAVDVLGQEKPHKIVFGNYSIGEDDFGLQHKTACFCIEFCDGSGYCGIEAEETIVVGNIYENPELIK